MWFNCAIYTNHPGGNQGHKHKNINLTWWENNPLQTISNSAEQTEKSEKIASPQITAHIFWSFPNGIARTIWFSNWHFRFSNVDGKFPWKLHCSFATMKSVYLNPKQKLRVKYKDLQIRFNLAQCFIQPSVFYWRPVPDYSLTHSTLVKNHMHDHWIAYLVICLSAKK